MEKLFKNEVDNAVKTVITFGKGLSTYYVDQLSSGWFGVSKDEKPLVKFNNELEAVKFAKKESGHQKIAKVCQ